MSSSLEVAGYTIYIILIIYAWIVLITVLLSWFSPNPHHPVMRFLNSLCNPPLKLIKRILPLTFGGLDFSPILFFIAIYFVANFIRLSTMAIGQGAATMVLVPIFCLCLLNIIRSLSFLLIILMIIRVFLSLVGASPYNPLVLVVYGTTEPLLSPLRGLLPKGPGGLDLRALLFLAFLLLFYAFVLVTLIKLTNVWVLSYYALDTITM